MGRIVVEAAPPPARRLERRLGLWSVTLAGVGVILGAGVYALIGPAAAEAGGGLWLAFLGAAVVAALTGYSYARFSTEVARNSPEFQYTSLGLGRRIGFASGWLMAWADLISIAAVALGFGGYLSHLLPLPIVGGAAILLVVLCVVTYMGIRESIGLVVTFTLIELAGLVFIIAVGLPFWGDVDYLEMPRGVGGVWTAAALVFFAYLGFDELGNLAEETWEPRRTLPRALLIAMLVTTVVYVAVSISAVSVAGWRELGASSAPLAVVAGKVLGSRAETVLVYVALAATTNTVLLLLVSVSRSLYGMASSEALPAWLASVGPTRTPWAAILLAGLVGVGFVLIGNLERVAQMTNATVLLSFIAVNVSLFVWSYRRQDRWTRRRVVRDILPPLAATGSCLWLLFYVGLEAVGLALVLAAFGLLLGCKVRKSASSMDQSLS